MQILRNYNLALYTVKRTFLSKLIFKLNQPEDLDADLKIEKVLKPQIASEIKEIAFQTREKLKIIPGTFSYEKANDQAEVPLSDLIQDLQAYNEALEGKKVSLNDFEDPLGFELLPGDSDFKRIITSTGSSQSSALQEEFDSMYESHYSSLSEVRKSLNHQPETKRQVQSMLQIAKDDLYQEQMEEIKNLKQEREKVLRDILAYLENKKQKVRTILNQIKIDTVEPSALFVTLDGQKVALLDYVEKLLDTTVLKTKIQSGFENHQEIAQFETIIPQEVLEITQQYTDLESYLKDLQPRLKKIQELQTKTEQKEELITKIKEDAQVLKAVFSKIQETSSASPTVAKNIKLIQQLEEDLSQDLSEISPADLVTSQEFLTYTQKRLQEDQPRQSEKAEVEVYLKQIESAENPLMVVEQLKAEKHLKILSASEFNIKYKKTGITNSYLVIEQEEAHPQLPNYVGRNWMIYLDEAYYDKLKRGEGNSERFRARIVHELGHREFEVSAKTQLEAADIYKQSEWPAIKNKFNQLLSSKKVGGDETGFEKDANVLNELYALRKENAVMPIQNNTALQALLNQFNQLVNPILGPANPKPKQKVFGAIDETEEKSGATEITDKPPERTDKDQAEINGLKKNLDSLKELLKSFGVEVDTDGQEEDKKKEDVFDITKVSLDGPVFLEKATMFYQNIQPRMSKESLLKMSDVKQWHTLADKYVKKLEEVENILSENTQDDSNFFKNLWKNTRFLSVDDVFQLITESWEFTQKRRDRNSSEARAQIGQRLFKGVPFLGLLENEYLSKEQDLELSAVGDYEKNLKNMSYDNIYPLLFAPKNRDHLKSVIQVLCEQGYMRWDDPRIWKALYKYSLVRVPNPKKAQNDIEYRNSWLQKIVADIWDNNTWDGFLKQQDNGLRNALSDFEKRADTLHALGAAPVNAKLKSILDEYKENYQDFIDYKGDDAIIPNQHYYKLLDYAFEKGKLNMEDKFYFLIEGVRYGILTVEDFRKIQTERFGLLPLLDFFYARRNNYKEIRDLSKTIEQNGGYPNGVHKMLMKEVLNDPSTLTRIYKRVTSDAGKVDHDDWQALMAVVRKQNIKSMLSRRAGGDAAITELSMVNGMTSYSSFVKAQGSVIQEVEAKGGKYNYSHLADSLTSFVTFDGLLMGRIGSERENVTWNESILERAPFNDLKLRDYQDSMYTFIKQIFVEYKELTKTDYTDYAESIFKRMLDKTEDEKAKIRKEGGLANDVDKFEKIINQIVKEENGKKAIQNAFKAVGRNMATFSTKEAEKFNYDSGFVNTHDEIST